MPPASGPASGDDLRLRAEEVAASLVPRAIASGVTIAVAESLTGGLLAGTLASVPGVSAVLRGGVVAYATELKTQLLDVDAELLATGGAVQAEVARQMATGVARRLGATYGLATTGVAGPDPQDGAPAGTVFLAVSTPARLRTVAFDGAERLPGSRARVRWASVLAALEHLNDLLESGGRAAGGR